MIKNALVATCVLGFVLCLLQTALGCECDPVSVRDTFAEAGAVFVGKVIKIVPVREANVGMTYKTGMKNLPWEKFLDEAQGVTLEVSEAFKGVTGDTVEVTSVYAGPGSCGVEFKEGESYLVYANKRHPFLAEDAAKLPERSWTQEMRVKAEADKVNEKLPSLATGICLRTSELMSREKDIDEIRRIIKR
jgi:hypothetical protein